eukprot:CAMPEP_0182446126 /NCGR_PEP_ID=MMETSP1172-20130603/4006_1 /TAXON_ID=708627 /ORGANISM="Timspurckia oligopyrenoides, Strain CCMP3278" /LENGTH=833 /DNA_ID=CAMNT_0024642007 /DNA_START=241 /DNA_END=2739 /DNA_ORIENTATION=-
MDLWLFEGANLYSSSAIQLVSRAELDEDEDVVLLASGSTVQILKTENHLSQPNPVLVWSGELRVVSSTKSKITALCSLSGFRGLQHLVLTGDDNGEIHLVDIDSRHSLFSIHASKCILMDSKASEFPQNHSSRLTSSFKSFSIVEFVISPRNPNQVIVAIRAGYVLVIDLLQNVLAHKSQNQATQEHAFCIKLEHDQTSVASVQASLAFHELVFVTTAKMIHAVNISRKTVVSSLNIWYEISRRNILTFKVFPVNKDLKFVGTSATFERIVVVLDDFRILELEFESQSSEGDDKESFRLSNFAHCQATFKVVRVTDAIKHISSLDASLPCANLAWIDDKSWVLSTTDGTVWSKLQLQEATQHIEITDLKVSERFGVSCMKRFHSESSQIHNAFLVVSGDRSVRFGYLTGFQLTLARQVSLHGLCRTPKTMSQIHNLLVVHDGMSSLRFLILNHPRSVDYASNRLHQVLEWNHSQLSEICRIHVIDLAKHLGDAARNSSSSWYDILVLASNTNGDLVCARVRGYHYVSLDLETGKYFSKFLGWNAEYCGSSVLRKNVLVAENDQQSGSSKSIGRLETILHEDCTENDLPLLVLNQDGKICVWNCLWTSLKQWKCENHPLKFSFRLVDLDSFKNVRCVCIAKPLGSNRVAAGFEDGSVAFFDLKAAKNESCFAVHDVHRVEVDKDAVTALEWNAELRLLVVGTSGGAVLIAYADTNSRQTEKVTFEMLSTRHSKRVTTLTIKQESVNNTAFLASGSSDGNIHVWRRDDTKTRAINRAAVLNFELIGVLKAHQADVLKAHWVTPCHWSVSVDESTRTSLIAYHLLSLGADATLRAW